LEAEPRMLYPASAQLIPDFSRNLRNWLPRISLRTEGPARPVLFSAAVILDPSSVRIRIRRFANVVQGSTLSYLTSERQCRVVENTAG
jgi:hypothetical protein